MQDEVFVPIAEALLDKYLLVLHDHFDNRDVVQCAGFGLGVFAKRLPKGGFKQVTTCLNALDKVIGEADARANDEKVESTENCIGAVGKIVL
jgi:hypothetical protein